MVSRRELMITDVDASGNFYSKPFGRTTEDTKTDDMPLKQFFFSAEMTASQMVTEFQIFLTAQ
jgi:predicted enzyme related to lactoylglutathione lyase